MSILTTRFSPIRPPSYAIGRYGEVVVVQGGGVRPLRWDGKTAASDAGMNAPAVAPTIAVAPEVQYYVARCDVYKGGDVYYAPPAVTFTDGGTPPTRAAVASSYLTSASVREIRVTDGGKGYAVTPTVSLSQTCGAGAEIIADLNIPTGQSYDPTALTGFEVVSGPPFADESDYAPINKTVWQAYGNLDIPLVNGSHRITKRLWIYTGQSGQLASSTPYYPVDINVQYTIAGVTGTDSVVRVGFIGHGFSVGGCTLTSAITETCIVNTWYSNGVGSVTALQPGTGFGKDDVVTITIPAYRTLNPTTGLPVAAGADKNLVIECYSAANPRNTTSQRYPVKDVRVTKQGSGYVVTPNLRIISETGFGAYATCSVAGNHIATATLENCGGGYKSPPTVEILSGGAEAFAVARPHLRGTYQCYYRYVDSTSASAGGPIPSNLSPVNEVDCGEGTAHITWTFTAPTGRQSKTELWRSASNEATTLYRVTADATAPFVDDLTDEELRDANRTDYAAMPIVMPNGDLNANRFGIPPSDKAVVVAFQDRFWYGVDTSGSEPNVLYFSEVDEPESVPDVNQLVIQQNVQSTDSVKALIPFGATLLAMQGRHAYGITYVRKPLVDAQVSLIAYRGCLNQRCWDIHDGMAYVMDQYGIYSITPAGEVQPLSDVIKDYFQKRVDFGNTTWFMLRFDPALNVLRCFVACKEDSGQGYPTRCLTYSPLTKSWWEERYPQRISGATTLALSNGDYRSIYGGTGGIYLLGEGTADAARGMILSVRVTDAGAGYATPPAVTVSGGTGALLEPALSGETGVASIWIKNGGFGYTSGNVTIGPPNDPTHPAPRQAVAEFTASPLTRDLSVATNYMYRSGNLEYIADADDPAAAASNSRDVRLLYSPQPDVCTVSLRSYYNNGKYARRNAARRDRGTGFIHSDVEPAARLDMSEYTRKYGSSSGMAQALFSGRTVEDVQAADHHVAIELDGVRRQPDPVIFYSVDVDGSKDAK